jgi:hypothetical protein
MQTNFLTGFFSNFNFFELLLRIFELLLSLVFKEGLILFY